MPRRSIVITFDKDDPTVASDIQFLQRLNDLRERYPSWCIQGVVHPDGRGAVIPKRPQQNSEGGGGDGGIAAWVESAVQQASNIRTATPSKRVNADDQSDQSSIVSDGNVIGEPPRDVFEGLTVTFIVPPYEGSVGKVSLVSGERFRVTTTTGSTWWCTKDDVVVAALGTDESGDSVAVSTMELNRMLQERVKELEHRLSSQN